jgi:nucleosome-remodeling factor subunit BPTF
MQTKPPNNDGKNQITTDTEITTTEILRHRHVGQFMERTQYLRRKVVIPLELPKTVRGLLKLALTIITKNRFD